MFAVVQLRGGLPGRGDPVQQGRPAKRQRRGHLRHRARGAEGAAEEQRQHAEQIHRAVLRGARVRCGRYVEMLIFCTINIPQI